MPLQGFFSGLNISATGLRAQRVRQNVISTNLANAETTRTAEGGAYKRQRVVLEADSTEFDQFLVKEQDKLKGATTNDGHMKIPQPEWPLAEENIGSGVKVAAIEKDDSPMRVIYDPSHPDADAKGYVTMPNVSVVEEMVDMITATRAYEANATAFNSTKQMLQKALEL